MLHGISSVFKVLAGVWQAWKLYTELIFSLPVCYCSSGINSQNWKGMFGMVWCKIYSKKQLQSSFWGESGRSHSKTELNMVLNNENQSASVGPWACWLRQAVSTKMLREVRLPFQNLHSLPHLRAWRCFSVSLMPSWSCDLFWFYSEGSSFSAPWPDT